MIKCPVCGLGNLEESQYCINCGSSLEGESPQAAADEELPPPPPSPDDFSERGTSRRAWQGSSFSPQPPPQATGGPIAPRPPELPDVPEVRYVTEPTPLLSIFSLVCGILGLPLCLCCGFFSVPIGLAAVVLGILGLKKEPSGKPMAIIGIIFGGLMILSTLLTFVVMIVAQATSGTY